MAPVKKSKKDANSINSKLALVMKSGKGKRSPAVVVAGAIASILATQSLTSILQSPLATSRPSRACALARPS